MENRQVVVLPQHHRFEDLAGGQWPVDNVDDGGRMELFGGVSEKP